MQAGGLVVSRSTNPAIIKTQGSSRDLCMLDCLITLV